MTARRFFACLPGLAVALFGPGCASLLPDHVTPTFRHSHARTTGRGGTQKTTGDEIDVSATYDLPRP